MSIVQRKQRNPHGIAKTVVANEINDGVGTVEIVAIVGCEPSFRIVNLLDEIASLASYAIHGNATRWDGIRGVAETGASWFCKIVAVLNALERSRTKRGIERNARTYIWGETVVRIIDARKGSFDCRRVEIRTVALINSIQIRGGITKTGR